MLRVPINCKIEILYVHVPPGSRAFLSAALTWQRKLFVDVDHLNPEPSTLNRQNRHVTNGFIT